MTGLLVRDAVSADADDVARIYGHYVRHSVATFDTLAPDAAEWAAKISLIRTTGPLFLVGELDGAVEGFGYLSVYRSRPAYRRTLDDTVYVAPSMLGHGYGRLLLAELLERAAGTDAHQLVAVIADGGDGASERLHASLGFRHAGRLTAVGHKFERWVDTVLMQRAVER